MVFTQPRPTTDFADKPTAAFGINCGETPEGEPLIFEANVAMIVHGMDPPDVFPYRQRQMRKVFGALRTMLQRAAGRALA